MPKIFNKHKDKIPKNAVYCGRGSPYGNPFRMRSEKDREYVCDMFERNVLPLLDVSSLKDKDLVCFCVPKRCHCNSILKKANDGNILT